MLSTISKYGFLVDPPVTSDSIGVLFTNGTLSELYETLVSQGESSLLEALYVGAKFEESDIQGLEDAVAVTVESDLDLVYSRLMCASHNHLRAFVRSIEDFGEDYVAQWLNQTEVDDILNRLNHLRWDELQKSTLTSLMGSSIEETRYSLHSY